MFPALQFIKRKIWDFESKQTGNVREHSSAGSNRLLTDMSMVQVHLFPFWFSRSRYNTISRSWSQVRVLHCQKWQLAQLAERVK